MTQSDLNQFILIRTGIGDDADEVADAGSNDLVSAVAEEDARTDDVDAGSAGEADGGTEARVGADVEEDTGVDKAIDDVSVLLGSTPLGVLDLLEGGRVMVECDAGLLASASFKAFPSEVILRIHSADGFGTFLFHEAEICRDVAGTLVAEFICHHPNKYWEGTWGLATLLGAIRDQVPHHLGVTVGDIELDDDWKRLSLRVPIDEGAALPSLQAKAGLLQKMTREAEIALGGIRWKPEYTKNERAFCEEVLAPLLRRMGFLSVRYTQGAREFGKDFTFSELTPFGFLRHYGLQAKADDVSGNVNSSIDELVGQADDAFKMPYIEIGSTEPRYISTFVIAISGRFTSNAKEKIVHKVPKGLHGSILFLDRESILELVERYWKVR